MDPITGTHCRQAGAIVPPFFLRVISSETCRGPTPAPRAKRTGQHAPPRASPAPPLFETGHAAEPRTADAGPCAAEPLPDVAGQWPANREPRTPDRQKRHGARQYRVTGTGPKIARRGQIFAAHGAVARVLVPCFAQIIM